MLRSEKSKEQRVGTHECIAPLFCSRLGNRGSYFQICCGLQIVVVVEYEFGVRCDHSKLPHVFDDVGLRARRKVSPASDLPIASDSLLGTEPLSTFGQGLHCCLRMGMRHSRLNAL